MSECPICEKCKHYVPYRGLVWKITRVEDCQRTVRVVGMDPVTGRPIYAGWKSARFERSSLWLFWLTYPIRRAKACGPAGRFFSPKEGA